MFITAYINNNRYSHGKIKAYSMAGYYVTMKNDKVNVCFLLRKEDWKHGGRESPLTKENVQYNPFLGKHCLFMNKNIPVI